MLDITRNVIKLFKQDEDWQSLFTQSEPIILQYGTEEDAEGLFHAFLDRPQWPGEKLFEPIRALGGERLARKIEQHCFQNEQLLEDMPEEILLSLGYMKYERAETLLWPYAAGKSGEYGHRQKACMGLLHLPCDSLKQEIETEVRACYGRNWWDSEYLPILSYKTGNLDLLKGLYDLGSTTASTDCNGGLVLGIALYGEAGRHTFQKLLWDPHWEAFAGATGTAYATALGCRYLQISPLHLYANLQTMCSQQHIEKDRLYHGFSLVRMMLEVFEYSWQDTLTIKFLPPVPHGLQELLDRVFFPENPLEKDIITLAREVLTDEEERNWTITELTDLREKMRLWIQESQEKAYRVQQYQSK